MNVEEIMSKELIVGYVPGTVEEALTILSKNDVTGIPVLKKGTDIIKGIVTRTDIFKNAEEDQLAMVMNEDYVSVKPKDNIEKAAKILYEQRIHGLPVVNTKNQLVGIISPKEILKILVQQKHDEKVESLSTTRVVPVYKETPINIVMEIINITNENALPILDEHRKVIGIVSDGDIFKLSQIKEGIEESNMGIGDDEDEWTWEGIRDTVRMYHSTSEVSLPLEPVEKVMIPKVKTATKRTPVCDVAKMMIKNDISHIPLVNSENRLVGMVTDIDLMTCVS
ncbi:MAG TPA: CBS domain-containing protein [Candidatus Thermoplasmatota archaeon]|nr:CBS domain-containing protein [Candidatus Thermoplasmatota archaeon]